MAFYRDRTCIQCGAVEYNTATRADTCAKCTVENKRKQSALEERAYLERLGYLNISGPVVDRHLHRTWTFTHECGCEQTWAFTNILKRVKMEPNIVPCSKCGGARRIAKAMAGYIAKYGITPEQLVEFERYSKKVRGMTAKTYKLHEAEINPLGLKRGQGPDDYHLDHKVSIVAGFKQGLDPEFIARRENLQMLTSKDNLSKGRK